MATYNIDPIDQKILAFLVKNARMPYLEIARECGVSGAAIHQRIKRLESNGVITGSRLLVKPQALGLNVCAFVSISLSESTKYPEVINNLKKIPEIVECHFVTGRFAILAKSIVATLKETLAPDTARVVTSYHHIGRRPVTPDIVREATTVLILYGVTYVIGALAGIASGYEASQAIFESVAMASNGGITSGIVAPGMAWHLELFYLFEMWAGRLEFVTLLALLIQIAVSATPSSLVGAIHARNEERKRRS